MSKYYKIRRDLYSTKVIGNLRKQLDELGCSMIMCDRDAFVADARVVRVTDLGVVYWSSDPDQYDGMGHMQQVGWTGLITYAKIVTNYSPVAACSHTDIVSFGSRKGYCKQCDATMEYIDFTWRQQA